VLQLNINWNNARATLEKKKKFKELPKLCILVITVEAKIFNFCLQSLISLKV